MFYTKMYSLKARDVCVHIYTHELIFVLHEVGSLIQTITVRDFFD